jgi:hypothetical protein
MGIEADNKVFEALADPTRRRLLDRLIAQGGLSLTELAASEAMTRRISDPAQVVLEATPYRRLSYTWHTITPECAKAVGLSDDYFAKVAQEPRSKVTFDLEPMGNAVKLMGWSREA